MKVLVLGAAGMAGHVVALHLRERGFEVETASNHNKLDGNTKLVDITNTQSFIDFLDTGRWDVIINCVGLLAKQSEERKDIAILLNAYLPQKLEHRYSETPTKIIHISTDGVFSFQKPPYREDSAYDAQSIYGRSKALGEIINSKDLTLRTSIVGPDLSPDGPSLFGWFYRQTGDISGFSEVMWNGVTTIELAKAIVAAMEQGLTGLYHITHSRSLSKFELLGLFKQVFERNVSIKPDGSRQLDSTLINTRNDFDFRLLDYPDMIREMRGWIERHPKLYPHYAI